MSITIRDLLAMPHLRLRLHSGDPGIDRPVSWAHTTDLPEPWQWVGRGDLLMTNGMSFPSDTAEQVTLVERLVEVGVSGLAIGERMYSPPLTAAFTEASKKYGLAVLWIGYPLPFVAISRAVAEATLLEQSQRLMRTARIYDLLRYSAQDGYLSSSIADALTKELGATVSICDRETGAAYHPDGPHPDPEVSAAVRQAWTGQASLKTGMRVVPLPGGSEVHIAEIAAADGTVLVLARPCDISLDSILVQHATTVAALELAQTRLALELTQRTNAEAANRILDGHHDEVTARRSLKAVGLSAENCVAAVIGDGAPERTRDLHVRLWRDKVPHLLTIRRDLVQLLVPAYHDLTPVVETLGPDAHLGVSAPLGTASRASEAGREAVWAMGAARRSGTRAQRFGEGTAPPGAASIEEAQSLVDRVLGPVLQHDADNSLKLLPTLESFLDNRRSWQATAAAMHVHRQTVLYRVKQVERLTGRELAETESVALIWLALQARRQLTGRPTTAV